jgi:hypothetical protein
MPDITQTISTLKNDVSKLAKETLNEYADQAISEADHFFETSKEDLKRWTEQFAEGLIDKGDLEYLIETNLSLAEMKFQTQLGLAKIKTDKFMLSLKELTFNAITDIALKAGL